MDKESLYKKCVDFHGHSCGGLLIGFRAALCAMEQFGISEPSPDEELVCIAENDACGIDAIQALLGCTAGKGNLILRLRGKQAFTFYDRTKNKSLRISPQKRKSMSSCAKRPHARYSRSKRRSSLCLRRPASMARTRAPSAGNGRPSRGCA